MAIIRGLTLALALAGLAGNVSAGAWPREEGSLFIQNNFILKGRFSTCTA